MKRTILYTIIFAFYGFLAHCQVAINTTGNAPGASAMLDIQSTTKGILIPRMTAAERGLIASPVAGLMVYQTNAPSGYYFFNGTAWKQVIDALAAPANPPTNDLLVFNGTNWIAKNLVIGNNGGVTPINITPPYLCLNFCICLYGIWPAQSGTDAFIGEIELFGFGYPPNGWAQCNGQLLSVNEYSALFSLMGTTYGGDGQTTFGLPDLRGRVPVSQGTGPGLSNKVIGESGGSESFTIPLSSMPVHSHPVTFQ
ncbi:MAG: tail fiber protein [Bacteroidales bacterium]